MPALKVQTLDGEIVEIDDRVIKFSNILKDVQEVCVGDGTVPKVDVGSAALKGVLQWADHHKDDPISENDAVRNVDIPSWDAEFLKNDQGKHFTQFRSIWKTFININVKYRVSQIFLL